MHYLKRMTQKKGEDAVSPIVGVMLMLVVTIIIAAVVSAFAGGLVSTNAKPAPTLNMNIKITNTGSWIGSGFNAVVTGSSVPIATKNLKIVTSWTTTMKDPNPSTDYAGTSLANIADGTTFTGGNTTLPYVGNIQWYANHNWASSKGVPSVAPFGFGPGLNESDSMTVGYTDANPTAPNMHAFFGNYSLMAGTCLYATPNGANSFNPVGGVAAPGVAVSGANGYGVTTPFQYTWSSETFGNDPAMAVLGTGWENLRDGDTVNVKFVYLPTGQTILSESVPVTEG